MNTQKERQRNIKMHNKIKLTPFALKSLNKQKKLFKNALQYLQTKQTNIDFQSMQVKCEIQTDTLRHKDPQIK